MAMGQHTLLVVEAEQDGEYPGLEVGAASPSTEHLMVYLEVLQSTQKLVE